MFAQPEPLTFAQHGHLYFQPVRDYQFAADLVAAPLSGSEVSEAAKHFPVVFPPEGQSLLPQAVLSLQQGSNAFVSESGQWQAPYVPAHIRRYPFILSKVQDSDRYTIALEREAPQLRPQAQAGADSQPLFDAEGNPGQPVERAQQFLTKYQQELSATERLLAPLQEQGLLVARQFKIGQGEEQAAVLSGFRVFDSDRLSQLEDATLGEWTRNGVLGMIFAHLHSLSNARTLAQRQQAQLANA